MDLKIQERKQMYFALTYDLDKLTALDKLNAFLAENGVENPKRYFLEMVVISRGKTSVTYIEYAVVPNDLDSKGDIRVSKVPEGQELVITMDKDEYEFYKMNGASQEIKTFLKERKLRENIGQVFPYIEMDGDNYIIHTPVR